jgi:hypothetical protein
MGWLCSSADLEKRENVRGDLLRWPRDSLCPQRFALLLPTSGGRSVGIVRSRTKAREFAYVVRMWIEIRM